MKIGRREVGEIVRGCVNRKKSSFLGSPRDVFRRPSAAPEPIAPKFLHTTFPSKYFVLAEFHPPRLSFGGVMPPTPSVASLHYGLPYSIWQAIIKYGEKRFSVWRMELLGLHLAMWYDHDIDFAR